MSISLALSLSTLFISLLQSIDGALLNITFLLTLYASAPAAAVLFSVLSSNCTVSGV